MKWSVEVVEKTKKIIHKVSCCVYMFGIVPWVDIDKDKRFGIFTRYPQREEVVVIPIEERLIVELYSNK